MSTITIKQKKVSVEIEGFRTVEVRRMRWKAGGEFFLKLAEALSLVMKNAPQDPSLLKLVLSKLPEIVQSSKDLAAFLCTESTDIKPGELDELDILSASAIIAASLSVNCDEEIKNFWGDIAVRLAAVMSPAPSPTTK